MTNPSIQNDFAYYRRTLNKMKANEVCNAQLCLSMRYVLDILFVNEECNGQLCLSKRCAMVTYVCYGD